MTVKAIASRTGWIRQQQCGGELLDHGRHGGDADDLARRRDVHGADVGPDGNRDDRRDDSVHARRVRSKRDVAGVRMADPRRMPRDDEGAGVQERQ